MATIRFTLNDRPVETEQPPTTTLLGWLRAHGWTGTKEGCAEGDCGACTVAWIDRDAPGGRRFRAVNACLVLLPMVQGLRVYTVEGLRDGDRYHPVQEAMVTTLGSQCGYCTPGVVMSLFEACYRDDLQSGADLDDQLCGNLCRCTGYRPIRDAATLIAGLRPQDRFLAKLSEETVDPVEALEGTEDRRVTSEVPGQVYLTPTTEGELWRALADHPEARLIAGGTDLSLTVTKRFEPLPALISLESLPGLRRIDRRRDGGWTLGATALLADLEAATAGALEPLHRMLRYFASRQIKNRATVGGNLCNASPIGDLAPVLLALGAELELRSAGGSRLVAIDRFFLDYRRTALAPGELLTTVEIPPLAADALASSYKVSKRRELDISAVAAAFVVALDHDTRTVTTIRAAYGGVAATPARAHHFERALVGQPWTRDAVEGAIFALDDDFQPIDDHRGSAWFRRTLAANLARGFFLETLKKPQPTLPDLPSGTVTLTSDR